MNDQDQKRIEEIRALVKAATPGPWVRPGVIPTHEDKTQADAVFIAASREFVPWVLDLVARQEAMIAGLTIIRRRQAALLKQAETENDRLTARCEALEKYVQEVCGCNVCKHTEPFKPCLLGKPCSNKEYWEIDETRFKEGGGE